VTYGNCPLCQRSVSIPGLDSPKCDGCGWVRRCKECHAWFRELTPKGICSPCFRSSQQEKAKYKRQRRVRKAA
jgi:RecJ-like exonuclease